MQRFHSLAFLISLSLSLCAIGCGPSSGGGGDGGSNPDSTLPPLPDEDGDGISDADEGRDQNTDTDGDGTPDYQDLDSDDDGVPDEREAGDSDTNTRPPDSDGDGLMDFRDTDADGNGRPDGVDGTNDTDGDTIGDFADLDDDGDMLNDTIEIGDPANPTDTDGDNMPDFRDADSDNDTIMDQHELATDPDVDGIPAYRDLDSDGDCRTDMVEAGDSDLTTPPIDRDGDQGPDFVDLDSDNDGLLDQLEDLNCNGVFDPGESDAGNEDTDGDGVSDLVEVAAGTDPSDPLDNPQANGDFVFEVPYLAPPDPLMDTLDFVTNITQADVFFMMDTTGSMGGQIGNLQSSLNSIISTLATDIPNLGVGVGWYKDFPTGTYGSGGDQPFNLSHRIMTVTTAAGIASVQGQVNAMSASGGNDWEESDWEGMYQVATGAGVGVGGASVPAFSPATAYPATPSPGESLGTIGGAGFRMGSLPIVVIIGDASGHNSEGFPAFNYSFGGAATRNGAVTALNALGVKVIGVASDIGVPSYFANVRADFGYAVNTTGAIVPPAAWGPVGTRPAGCGIAQCCTGQSGAGEGTDGAGMCPLNFVVSSSGTGLGSQIITAIKVLTTYGVIDIGAAIADDPSDGINAVQEFVDRLQANPSAPPPCVIGLSVIDTNGDGILDTFSNVNPGTIVCFDVIPKMNTTVPPTTMPQMFKATITVTGDGITTLDTRDVFFLVPPEIPDPPIM